MRAGLADGELGEVLRVLGLLGRRLPGVEDGPAGLDDADAPGAERDLVRLAEDGRHLADARRVEGGDEAEDDGVVHLLERRAEGAGGLAGGDDGVVVGDLAVVVDPGVGGEAGQVEPADLGRPLLAEVAEDAGHLGLEVAREVARVGPRVRDQLGLVERLRGLERGVGRHPVAAVHLALEVGQVVEQGGPLALGLLVDLGDAEGLVDGPGRGRPARRPRRGSGP